jgi:HD-GYP domain-containing protein (c-di-GMP phosphodiesterase class II)
MAPDSQTPDPETSPPGWMTGSITWISHDLWTHGERVATHALEAARHLTRLSTQDEADILITARFHDIGKLALSRRVLNLPRALTTAEREHVRRHPDIGANTLASVVTPSAAAAIRHHHEWWNGKGYPARLSGTAIPLAARLVAILDAFDAIISHRPYRSARTVSEAKLELLRGAGTQFDPVLVEVVLATLPADEHTITRSADAPIRRV